MLQRLKSSTVWVCMELEEFVDLLLKQYGDRKQYPDDEEQLKTLLSVFAKTTQALREEKAALERLSAFRTSNKPEFKKKTKQ